MSVDEKWMQWALELAQKGRGHVSPNPMVGAVLVKNNRVVGEGFHRRFGGPHAEVEALRKAGNKARGSTLYVTLEPCAHFGKTPPCTTAVREAGVRRVVAAMKDPNPLVSGKGFRILKQGRASVTIGVLEEEARHLNRAFITWVTQKRPYVTLKAATSLDGRSATVTGESKWITGEKARRAGHVLRAQVDAIAVGAGTVITDNPSLTAHGLGRNPIRIIFAGRRSLPRRSSIFDQAAPTRVFKSARGKVNVRAALSDLAKQGIAHLLIEGGRTLQQSFFEAGVVDEVVWFIAPMIIGRARQLRDAWRLQPIHVGWSGEDLCLYGAVSVEKA